MKNNIIAECSVSETAKLVEVVYKLLTRPLLCVVDGCDKVIGVITKKDIPEDFTSNANCIAGDICNKNFSYTTIDTVEKDSHILKERRVIPMLDDQSRLLFILYPSKTYADWKTAQAIELDYWREELRTNENHTKPLSNRTEFFRNRLRGYIGSDEAFNILLERSKDRKCMEMGGGGHGGYASVLAPLASQYTMIEPLADDYASLRQELKIDIPSMHTVSMEGECFFEEMKNSIDGVCIFQNALDHTPNWPFLLNNITSYLQKDALLYLWSDVYHLGQPNKAHFNITNSPNALIRLVENLGFEILHKRIYVPFENLCVTCVARKL